MEIITEHLNIPFNFDFTHAAKTRSSASAVLVRLKRGGHTGYGEGCPREYVTGETMADAMQWIQRMKPTIAALSDVDALRLWVAENETEIDHHPAAWCAVETALLDLWGQEQGLPIHQLLGLGGDFGNQKLTAVVGNGPLEFVQGVLDLYLAYNFCDFKVKLAGTLKADQAIMDIFRRKLAPGNTLRVDFNNVFSSDGGDAFKKYYEALDYRFTAIEEPFEPGAYAVMAEIAEYFDTPIILDESFTPRRRIDRLKEKDLFIPSIKVSKMGGILRTIGLMKATINDFPSWVLSCHVGETSILSRLWLMVAGYGSKRIMAREGAFSTHLLQRDLTDQPIIFNNKTQIDTPVYLKDAPGLGININYP